MTPESYPDISLEKTKGYRDCDIESQQKFPRLNRGDFFED